MGHDGHPVGGGRRQDPANLQGARGGITGVALARDGKHVVTGSDDGTTILWQTAGAKILQTFRQTKLKVLSVALSRDGKDIVTGLAGGTAVRWAAADGKKTRPTTILRVSRAWLSATTVSALPPPPVTRRQSCGTPPAARNSRRSPDTPAMW
jgi:WD40 repeat protein